MSTVKVTHGLGNAKYIKYSLKHLMFTCACRNEVGLIDSSWTAADMYNQFRT